ncbi:putative nucleotidyltransferase, ribonuclease H [Tanacetum coccineum]
MWTGKLGNEYLCLVEFAYNNSWHASIKGAPFELLYGRKCRAPICWNEVGERVIEGPELVKVRNEKLAITKEKLKEARSRQKLYTKLDRHRSALGIINPGVIVWFLKYLRVGGLSMWHALDICFELGMAFRYDLFDYSFRSVLMIYEIFAGYGDSISFTLTKKTVNPNSPNPNSYPSKLPYPERMKVRENDKPSAQHSRFLKMFKQLRLEIGLKRLLLSKCRSQQRFKLWLRNNKEKLEDIAIKKLGLEALNPTRIDTRSCQTFCVVNFEPDPRVPIILGTLFAPQKPHWLFDTKKLYFKSRQRKNLLLMPINLRKQGKEVCSCPFLSLIFSKMIRNVNLLFEENDKDAEIKSSSSFTLTSPEEREVEAYLEIDSIPPGTDLSHPPTLEVSSSNPTSPTSPEKNTDSPFTASFVASVSLNSLGNEDKVFNPGILVYHASHDKNLVTLEENLKENISSGTLLVFKEPSFLLPPPEPPDDFLNFKPNLVLKNVMLNEDFYQSNVEDVNSFTIIIWIFLPYFPYPEESPKIFSFRSETFVFDPGIVTFHKPVGFLKLRGKKVYSSASIQPNGRDSSVKSRAIIGLLKHRAHAAMKETQRGVGFALNTLTQLAQAVTSKNDSLAIRVSVQNDQTAQNHLAMIRESSVTD